MKGNYRVPVSEAASLLHVNPSRVRSMIHAGILDAEKVGDRWLIDRASIERRAAAKAPAGRLLSHANAWALLPLAGEKDRKEKDSTK